MSEVSVDPKLIDKTRHPGPLPETVVAHLDKSHICVHTYPESHPEGGLCTFRADIEVSTCGVISPLKALNYLIHQLESDIVTIDYRARFTRDINGMKHFIDHEINSIQNFMSDDMKALYDMVDVNVYQENIFYTKMLCKGFDLKHYMFCTKPEDLTDSERQEITAALWKENARNLLRAQYASCLTGSGGAPQAPPDDTSAARNCGKPPRPAENPRHRITGKAFFVVVVHPLFHFIASEFQLLARTITSSPSITGCIPCPARCQDRSLPFRFVRCLFHFIKQGQVFFHLFIKPVPDHFMPHGHTHLYPPVISREIRNP